MTPVASTSACTCFGSGPSPTMPMMMFITWMASSSGASSGTPKRVRSAATLAAKDIARDRSSHVRCARRGEENLGVELLLCSTLVPLTFSGNVRLPVHPYERWGYFSRLERLWRASTRHACSHVPSRVARYVGIELSCDDESIVRRRSSTGEFAQELAGWCSFIVFNFWQQRLPGETTRKPRLPGRHWSVALAFPGSSSACRVREPTVGARGSVEEGFPARLGSLPIALRNPF